ncbi:MAG: SPOR domain-containing protein, partial [Pseudomonadota bacterium]
ALGMFPNTPAPLVVTALKRAPVAAAGQPAVATTAAPAPVGAPAPLGAPGAAAPAPVGVGPAPVAAAAPVPGASSLAKPFVQVGIFSVRANADAAVRNLQNRGVGAELRPMTAGDKSFWRVLAGPATSTADRDRILTQARAQGFADAYAVRN